MPGEHLSPAELAAREGVPLGTVYAWNYTGDGPRYFKAGAATSATASPTCWHGSASGWWSARVLAVRRDAGGRPSEGGPDRNTATNGGTSIADGHGRVAQVVDLAAYRERRARVAPVCAGVCRCFGAPLGGRPS